MAYAALVSLAQTIDLILDHPKYSVPRRDKKQMIRVKKNGILLQEFLEDFPEKAKSYEARIRGLTQEAEDILEFSLSEHIQQRHNSSLRAFLSNNTFFCLFPRKQWLHSSVGSSKNVMKEIELVTEKLLEIKNSIITAKDDERVSDSTHVPSTSAPVQEEAMVGLGNNLMEVKIRLCRDSSELESLPIVGMGGIGKTTLARNVYDDPLITDRFDVRGWVTVSQDYHIQDIVSGLLVSMGVELQAEDKLTEEQHNVEYYKVHQHLKGRRYLIVIDDIWSIEAWDEIKLMFPDDGNGSRIVLTTRLYELTTYAGSFHEMRLMDDDESWDLLRQKVFKQVPYPNELESIGKTIARSCRGLPLAVVVISGLLAVDQTEASWKNIAKDVKSTISANNEQIDKILSLSYTHLPHHLRPCFLYMGGFPEDYKMRVSTITKLWVAEGFLKPDESKCFEETAKEYLEDLVNRSLLLVTKRKSNGKIKFLGIHDLMREMCIRKSQEEKFFLHVRGVRQRAAGIRRVSTIRYDLNFHENVDASTTRTIICLKNNRLGDEGCCLQHFKLLRILAVSTSRNKDTNRCQVFELFHIRYLSFNSPFDIPASISNLQNLQTLVIGLKDRHRYVKKSLHHKLPVEIFRMPQLRHLLFYYSILPFDEAGEFPLENLQTISGAINFVCGRKIVKIFPNLKKLGLTYFVTYKNGNPKYESLQCKQDYELENLKYLQQLEILKIVVDGPFRLRDGPKLTPDYPRTLKKLSLDYLGVSWKDMTNAVASLPCLEVLKLRHYACVGGTWETTDGGFPKLKFLLIDELRIRHWITESSHFPRLKFLAFHRCWRLHEIPECIGEISTLELIEVDDENKSLVHSAKQIQEDQQSYENDALQVHVLKRELVLFDDEQTYL